MTQLVGAICEDGNKVITVSDRMVSTGDMTLTFEHPHMKAVPVSERAVVLIAGTVHEPDLIREAKQRAKGKERIVNIAEVLKQVYQNIRESHVVDEILKPRLGIGSFQEWREAQKTLFEGIVADVDQDIQRYGLGLTLLLAGVDEEAHLIRVSDPGRYRSYDNLSYCCIGMGNRHADNVFAWYRYSRAFSLNDAIYIAFEAKKRAEMAGGVGQSTDIVIIDRKGIKKVSPDTVSYLEVIYNDGEAKAERRGFDKRIAELEIQASAFETTEE